MKKINLTEYIRKSAHEIRLTESERDRMKRVVSEYMAMKPLRVAPLERRAPVTHGLLSIYVFSRKYVALVLVGAILFSGTGISFAAETAMPGDVLYPIKVGVNEPVIAALSVSQEAKALWNAERVERRLEEVARLAVENRLTSEAEVEFEERLEKDTERVVADVERLVGNDTTVAVDIAERLENKLLAHETVLSSVAQPSLTKKIKDRLETKTKRLLGVRDNVRGPAPAAVAMVAPVETVAMMSAEPVAFSETQEVGARMMSAEVEAPKVEKEAAPDVMPRSVETVIAHEVLERTARAADKELANTEKLFERIAERLSEDAATRTKDRIADIQEQISAGSIYLAQGDTNAAFESYRAAVAGAVRLQVYLKAFQKSRISIPDDFAASASEHDKGGEKESEGDKSDDD